MPTQSLMCGRRQAHPRRRRRHGRPDRCAIKPISRALDLAGDCRVPRSYRRHGRLSPVRLHLDVAEAAAELQEALDLGVHLFAGEAEGRMAEVLCDVAGGNAKPIYNFSTICRKWRRRFIHSCRAMLVTRVAEHHSSFDAGRGCPFQCSFCTIINVQGRNRVTGRRTTSRPLCEPTRRRTSRGFSSPTIILRATATGNRSSTG